MANAWSVITDLAASEEASWTTVVGPTTLNAEAKAWKVKPAILSPLATTSNTFLGWGAFVAEEYAVLPEDDAIVPEESQADVRDWTILPEPT